MPDYVARPGDRAGDADLWNKPAGTWRWMFANGVRYLEVVIPGDPPSHDFTGGVMDFPVVEGPHDKEKHIWGWDGNFDSPTLNPSLGVGTPFWWHGWCQDGMLNAAE